MIWLLPIFNLIGGRGWLPLDKFICRCVLMPLVVCMSVDAGWVLSLLIFACFSLWSTPGHGKYFSAIHGRDDVLEHEIGWIDSLGYRLYPPDAKEFTNLKRGRFCMGLRGMFLYPLFIVLAFINPLAPLIGLGMFLQGLCYSVRNESTGVKFGEFLTGGLIAILVALV